MHKTTIRLASAAALCWGTAAGAQTTLPGSYIVDDAETSRVGTRGANFLHIGIGARAQGMGTAGSASTEGPAALFWNPANIAGREQFSAFVSYMSLYGNSGLTDIAGAISIPVGQGAVGFSMRQFSSGDIARTTEVAPDGNDPTFPGNYQWTSYAFAGHYARNITDRLAAAVGVRFVQEGVDFAKAGFFGADISTRFRTGLYGLTVSAALQNIGTNGDFDGPAVDRAILASRENGQQTGRDLPIEYATMEVQMPTAFTFGLLANLYGDAEAILGTSEMHAFKAEVDFRDAVDTDIQPSIGAEYAFRNRFFVRAGKKFMNERHADWEGTTGTAFGAGLRVPFLGRQMTLDYAYVMMGQLQSNQIISFEVGQ